MNNRENLRNIYLEKTGERYTKLSLCVWVKFDALNMLLFLINYFFLCITLECRSLLVFPLNLFHKKLQNLFILHILISFFFFRQISPSTPRERSDHSPTKMCVCVCLCMCQCIVQCVYVSLFCLKLFNIFSRKIRRRLDFFPQVRAISVFCLRSLHSFLFFWECFCLKASRLSDWFFFRGARSRRAFEMRCCVARLWPDFERFVRL